MKNFITTFAVMAIALSPATLLGEEHTYRPKTDLQLKIFSHYLAGTFDAEILSHQAFEQCFSRGIRSRYTNDQFDALTSGIDTDTACELFNAVVDQGAFCAVKLVPSDFLEEHGLTADEAQSIAVEDDLPSIIYNYCDPPLREYVGVINNLCLCVKRRREWF